MRKPLLCLLLVVWCCRYVLPQTDTSKEGKAHARKVVSSLSPDSELRRLVEYGRFGDGVERPYQVQMRQFGIKAAAVEVHMIWFFGPKRFRPVRVIYFRSYDGGGQITDPAILAKIQASGVKQKLEAEAKRAAPHGFWTDLPHPVFWPFRASTLVFLWDDPWLPTPPHRFTTFGPGRPPLVAAVGIGDLADIDRLLAGGKIDHKDINEALWYACSDEDAAILQRLLKAGADVNQTKAGKELGTPLMVAVWSNAAETVKILLASGAKVNGAQGKYGETPLTLAAGSGPQSIRIVKMLLDAGADVKAANSSGITAVIKAANHRTGPASLLELLVAHGADVNAKTHTGRAALAFAAELGNIEAVKFLLAAHADVNARDDQGQSALDVAANENVVELLTAAGGKR